MDRCACCGIEIVEGEQVCYACSVKRSTDEMTKEELTFELNKFKKDFLGATQRIILLEEEMKEISSKFLKVCERIGMMQ